MGFNLPHKANSREIITAKGYPGTLFLVGAWTEEIEHAQDGTVTENVLYTCTDIDNYKNVKVIFDEDVEKVVCTADKSDKFIADRQKQAGLPVVQKPQSPMDDIFRMFSERQAQQQSPAAPKKKEEKPTSKWEIERQEAAKLQEYIDFLLDKYIDLTTLQTVLGEEEARTRQIAQIKAEFEKKTGKKIDEKSTR